MMASQEFKVAIRQMEHFRFEVDWGLPTAEKGIVDEAPPLGGGAEPNPARLLAVAVAHCLSSSLLFCIEKAHGHCDGITTTAHVRVERNERGRWRLTRLRIILDPRLPAESRATFERCRELFEDYCIVTESVRKGIPVDVEWAPSPGQPSPAVGSPSPGNSPPT